MSTSLSLLNRQSHESNVSGCFYGENTQSGVSIVSGDTVTSLSSPKVMPDVSQGMGQSSWQAPGLGGAQYSSHGIKSGLKKTRYPATPDYLVRAWKALIPAIIELSYHTGTHSTLPQFISKLSTRTGGKKSLESNGSGASLTLSDWMHDIVIPIGSIPGGMTGNGIDNDYSFYSDDNPSSVQITSQCRIESYVCLEILASKVWYQRNRQGISLEAISDSIFDAILFLYWECGIPSGLGFMTEAMDEPWHPYYDKIRATNFRQINWIKEQGGIEDLISRIELGTQIAKEKRASLSLRYRRLFDSDLRWEADFSDHCASIKSKYASPINI